MASPCDMYARLLLKEAQGFPLFVPIANINRPQESTGIQVGDFGYFSRDGRFIVLFNMSFSKDHAINTWHGVPDDFDHTDLGPNDNHPGFYPPKAVICYSPKGPVKIKGSATEASILCVRSILIFPLAEPVLLMHRHTSGAEQHNHSSSSAAALLLPNGGSNIDCLPDLSWWAAKNAVICYDYAVKRGYSVPNGALYLVTGVTQSDSWHISTFAKEDGGNFGFFEATMEDCLAQSGQFSVFSHIGLHDYFYLPQSPNSTVNQTLSMHGHKMSLSPSAFSKLDQKATVINHKCFDFLKLGYMLLGGQISQRTQQYHPSNAINNYLLAQTRYSSYPF